MKDEDRARIARGWRQSGRTQAQYAAEHRITDRTLRMWIARWAPRWCALYAKALSSGSELWLMGWAKTALFRPIPQKQAKVLDRPARHPPSSRRAM